MEVVVEFALVEELGMFSAGRLKFDCYLEVCFSVYTLVDLPEGPLATFFRILKFLPTFCGKFDILSILLLHYYLLYHLYHSSSS